MSHMEDDAKDIRKATEIRLRVIAASIGVIADRYRAVYQTELADELDLEVEAIRDSVYDLKRADDLEDRYSHAETIELHEG